ncbi:hypothetical protein K7X08_015131 [Anisodus acutangulus]|uniref:Uncharacterized protein n=1 Tax=Anisodus acutangulus TaxID=402998 RepID=A0A9Q1L595_9SOLA|nr:hypothetical protein K7X08_015131 [Anisodus acutangulus]
MTTPYYWMTGKVRVMVVDHDKEYGSEMANLLKSYGYKVTMVGMTSRTMTMLSKEKKIDMMIINVHSPDLLSFQFLAQAVALDIVSLFVCDEHNELLAKKALGDGAYLYLKKPLDEEIVKYLWQFVLREKLQKDKAKEGSEIGNTNVGDKEQVGEKNLHNTEKQRNNIHEAKNYAVSNRKDKTRRKRGRKSIKEINEGESQISANKVVKEKVCTKWTVELHAKFIEVVHQLGEGRCFPKKILHVMNVPGLSRMQVASHLQKCRNKNWRAPNERKYIRRPSGQRSSSGSQKRSSFIKFGTKPHFQTNVSNLQQQQRNPGQTQSRTKFLFSSLNTNNIVPRGESSTHQLYRSKLHVQPHYLNIGSLFNNSFLSAQNNIGGGLQQQHGPLFGMVGSQGVKYSIIGSPKYRPKEFNNGDHHCQNDYSFDLNATYVPTYSGSRIIFGTDIENATINEVRSANANFHQYIDESNMSDSTNIVMASYASDTQEGDSNEKKNCDAYFGFNNMNYIFQNLGPPDANLPNEFDQVYSDDQVSASM